jgi:hypothetical protein
MPRSWSINNRALRCVTIFTYSADYSLFTYSADYSLFTYSADYSLFTYSVGRHKHVYYSLFTIHVFSWLFTIHYSRIQLTIHYSRIQLTIHYSLFTYSADYSLFTIHYSRTQLTGISMFIIINRGYQDDRLLLSLIRRSIQLIVHGSVVDTCYIHKAANNDSNIATTVLSIFARGRASRQRFLHTCTWYVITPA